MKFSQEFGAGTFAITAYDDGLIKVNGTVHTTSLIIAPEQLDTEWAAETFDDLSTESLAPVLEWGPEIVVLGTGARQRFPTPAVFRMFQEKGVGLEVMDTGSACRTYNVLMAEGRRVAAALLLI